MSVKDKKDKAGPRKLLAMDGGGIRGVMTLEVLEKIESELQQRLGRGDDFVLADYFDYVAGTSTDSPWPISNNPDAKYNDCTRADCNLNLPLWQLVRASTAAPTYFPPEVVNIGKHEFIFVDGGVTMYNNPAFQLFLMATVKAC